MRALRHVNRQTEARWLDQIRAIASRILAPYDVDLYLFGSRARGDARLASDIDLALEPKGALPSKALLQLADEFEESTVPVRVDVFDLRHAGVELRANVMHEGIQWIVSQDRLAESKQSLD